MLFFSCPLLLRTSRGPLIARRATVRPSSPHHPRFYTAVYESKYADKIRERAEEKGLSVDELKTKIKQEQLGEQRRKWEARLAQQQQTTALPHLAAGNGHTTHTTSSPHAPAPAQTVRKDSSPVKPLSSILNLPKLLSTPHTKEQISALWTAYHASRSGGTGRGFVCAAVPLDLYRKMTNVAQRYPTFIVPVARPRDPNQAPTVTGGEENRTAYEFYFLQWDFHGLPPAPSVTDDPFAKPLEGTPTASNVQTSTVLFTPLQEYKLRNSFATPYLVLTHYTDLASTHGVVLLRGEITPTSAAGEGGGDLRYLLKQEDAQMLSMALQKFYLWDGDTQETEAGKLLRCFHESPEEFKWEDLLKHADLTA